MKEYRIEILLTIILILSITASFVLASIDPGPPSPPYSKEVNLATGGTALIEFPQATSDNGEGNHHLVADPNDLNSIFDNFFTNAKAGKFFLFYDGNDTVDEEILMIALGQDYDDHFSIGLQWQINDGTVSQNIPLESADFNSNEYGYYPQWNKIAQSGKPLISTGSDQDTYYVIYVKLGFDGQVMQKGDVLSINYALDSFDTPGTQLIFNVYGSIIGDNTFRLTNKNSNTFGINSSQPSAQQNPSLSLYNYPFSMYPYGVGFGGYYGGGWPTSGFSGYGWGFQSPAGPIYGYNYGALPYSFLGGSLGASYGYSPFGGAYGGFNSSYPFSGFYYSGWSYGPSSYLGFLGTGFGGSFFNYGGYTSYYPVGLYSLYQGGYSFY